MQNGVVAEKMKEAGIDNQTSFGLSIAQIRMIALDYNKDQNLAFFLLRKSLRESKLLSLHLFDANIISYDLGTEIVNELNTIELAEQASRLLLSKVPDAETIMLYACNSDSEFAKMTGFLLLAQLSLSTKHEFENEPDLFALIEQNAIGATTLVMRSISYALRKFSTRNQVLKSKGIQLMDRLRNSDNYPSRWIAEEASLELDG